MRNERKRDCSASKNKERERENSAKDRRQTKGKKDNQEMKELHKAAWIFSSRAVSPFQRFPFFSFFLSFDFFFLFSLF